MEILAQLYQTLTGTEPTTITPLAGAGSNRRYYRLTGVRSLVGVVGESTDENKAFIGLSRHFHGKGLPVPEVEAYSPDLSRYLQTDLGNLSLFDAIAQGRTTGKFSPEEMGMLTRTIRRLPDLQFRGAEGLDFGLCYPQPAFDRRTVMWDLNYMKYCFLRPLGVPMREDWLEDDFCRMADLVLAEDAHGFMLRDCQSRNVMMVDGQPWFIDFQGGRRGPYLYDVASMLWQARANFSDEVRTRLLAEYADALRAYLPQVDPDDLRLRLRHFVLLRIMQTLGAYGLRGLFERKPHFLHSIPPALANLQHLLSDPPEEYPYLCQVLLSIDHEPSALSQWLERKELR